LSYAVIHMYGYPFILQTNKDVIETPMLSRHMQVSKVRTRILEGTNIDQ